MDMKQVELVKPLLSVFTLGFSCLVGQETELLNILLPCVQKLVLSFLSFNQLRNFYKTDCKIYRSNYVKSVANQCLKNSCYVYLSEPGHAFIIIQQAQTVFNCLIANYKLDLICVLIVVTAFWFGCEIFIVWKIFIIQDNQSLMSGVKFLLVENWLTRSDT